MLKYLNLLLSLFACNKHIVAQNKNFIQEFCLRTDHPLSYGLEPKLLSSNSSRYMLCFHGSGANNQIADAVQSYGVVLDNIISFNFPDHDKGRYEDDPKLSTFGSIQELLPALYMLKNLVIDGALEEIDLYGFSAGGGVIVNMLAVLAGNRFDTELASVGITPDNKLHIISAVERGLIILDCPLKSIEEIIAFRGGKDANLDTILETYAARYREHNLRPIDSITRWKNYNLKILLYFEVPDEIVSNRDDDVFIDLLRKHNAGTTQVVFGSHGGHGKKHDVLWHTYVQIRQ